MDWQSRYVLPLVRPTRWRSNIYLDERKPYGSKHERIRAIVVGSMQSGDSTAAGTFATPLHAFAHFSALSAQVKRRLAKVTAPALILYPRQDDMASLDNALTIQRRLGGLVELVVLDDSYHIITLDKQRHVVVERSAAFARALERERAGTAPLQAIRQSGHGD
jgi:carboxylesterase